MPIGTNKAKATGAIGALITLGLIAAHAFGVQTGCDTSVVTPDVVASAVLTLISTASTYFVPHGGTSA